MSDTANTRKQNMDSIISNRVALLQTSHGECLDSLEDGKILSSICADYQSYQSGSSLSVDLLSLYLTEMASQLLLKLKTTVEMATLADLLGPWIETSGLVFSRNKVTSHEVWFQVLQIWKIKCHEMKGPIDSSSLLKLANHQLNMCTACIAPLKWLNESWGALTGLLTAPAAETALSKWNSNSDVLDFWVRLVSHLSVEIMKLLRLCGPASPDSTNSRISKLATFYCSQLVTLAKKYPELILSAPELKRSTAELLVCLKIAVQLHQRTDYASSIARVSDAFILTLWAANASSAAKLNYLQMISAIRLHFVFDILDMRPVSGAYHPLPDILAVCMEHIDLILAPSDQALIFGHLINESAAAFNLQMAVSSNTCSMWCEGRTQAPSLYIRLLVALFTSLHLVGRHVLSRVEQALFAKLWRLPNTESLEAQLILDWFTYFAAKSAAGNALSYFALLDRQLQSLSYLNAHFVHVKRARARLSILLEDKPLPIGAKQDNLGRYPTYLLKQFKHVGPLSLHEKQTPEQLLLTSDSPLVIGWTLEAVFWRLLDKAQQFLDTQDSNILFFQNCIHRFFAEADAIRQKDADLFSTLYCLALQNFLLKYRALAENCQGNIQTFYKLAVFVKPSALSKQTVFALSFTSSEWRNGAKNCVTLLYSLCQKLSFGEDLIKSIAETRSGKDFADSIATLGPALHTKGTVMVSNDSLPLLKETVSMRTGMRAAEQIQTFHIMSKLAQLEKG